MAPLCVVCAVVAALVGCVRTDTPSSVEKVVKGRSCRKAASIYTVQSGDTTLQIARAYKVREDALVKLNDLKPPYTLKAGMRLKIPSTTQKSVEHVREEKDVAMVALDSATDGKHSDVGQRPSIDKNVGENRVEATVGRSGWSMPVSGGTILHRFGAPLPNRTTSDGVTWRAPLGTPVVAAQSGVVIKAGREIPAYGNMVVVRHGDGRLSVYTHLKRIDKGVKVGQSVVRGQVVGQVGQTGSVSEPQLHFQVRDKDASRSAIDPLRFLS